MSEEAEDAVEGNKEDNNENGKGKQRVSAEDAIREYIGAYIDSYMDHVEELNVNESEFPLFYTNYPFEVAGYILPDKSLCILFSGLAPAMKIEVQKGAFKKVDSEIAEKKYHHICCYPPSFLYTKDNAKTEARSDVKQDIENAKQLSREDIDGINKAETLRSLRLLAVAMPWIQSRKSLDPARTKALKSESSKFEPGNLKLDKEADFSEYQKKLGDLETTLLGIKQEVPSKDSISTSTVVPLPPPPPQGTNINIEIKQPEAQVKEDTFDDNTDLDILRLKKTLYIQTTDIEDLRRGVIELTNKMATYEQLRQTVFRMNRKVYDADARMGNVEKSNRETMKKAAEMRLEQREENKKTRRFIIDKTKKARNQAMTIGFVAIGISVVTLIFGLPLIIDGWETISNFFGI